MARHLVKKPTYPLKSWLLFFAIRLVFPPVLAWDFFKVLFNRLLGGWIGTLIVPAQKLDLFMVAINDASVLDQGQLKHEKHTIVHNNAELDTLEIKHLSQSTLEPECQQYVVCCFGNNDYYERHVTEMQETANELQANVVGFNYRSVGQSKGSIRQIDDLVDDLKAQIQHLINRGVSPQNITVNGHSIGAALAAKVTAHFHQLQLPINVFINRGFSSFTDIGVAHIRRGNLNNFIWGVDLNTPGETPSRIRMATLMKPFIKFLLCLTKWEIEAGNAFKSIPNTHKDYIVVRSQKDKATRKEERFAAEEDRVIPYAASIHSVLKEERKRTKAETLRVTKKLTKHLRPERQEELEAERARLNNVKVKYRTRKMHPLRDGHNEPLKDLRNRYDESGARFFHGFCKKTFRDHGVNTTAVEKRQMQRRLHLSK